MIQKNYISLLCLLAIASSCSMLPTKKLEVVSKPLKIDIMQPDLPRPVNSTIKDQKHAISLKLKTQTGLKDIPIWTGSSMK